ncbi:retrotransposon protein, putative, ty1-copia subclass [Tanacetum coccineum]
MCLFSMLSSMIRDHGEPANYKAALLDPESDKWLNAMNVEMQSMKDNEGRDLVDLPPNGKTVGSKRLFKKKTDMDGVVHTYKARLVAKGYTQTSGIDYEKNLLSYVKTAFLNGYLSKEVYMEQPKEKLRLSISQGASTPVELKRMQNVPYASVVGSIMVSCYTDVGYLTDADDLKSQTGYVFILNGGVVGWKSAKQSIFATSSA